MSQTMQQTLLRHFPEDMMVPNPVHVPINLQYTDSIEEPDATLSDQAAAPVAGAAGWLGDSAGAQVAGGPSAASIAGAFVLAPVDATPLAAPVAGAVGAAPAVDWMSFDSPVDASIAPVAAAPDGLVNQAVWPSHWNWLNEVAPFQRAPNVDSIVVALKADSFKDCKDYTKGYAEPLG
jgi:hypothetical protein